VDRNEVPDAADYTLYAQIRLEVISQKCESAEPDFTKKKAVIGKFAACLSWIFRALFWQGGEKGPYCVSGFGRRVVVYRRLMFTGDCVSRGRN
jgi:hypothetical protein